MRAVKKIHESRFEEIFSQAVEDMTSVGTYKVEFSPAITRYAEMRVQFEIVMEQWYRSGCKIMEPYTNKAGAENNRKTVVYQAIENLRREITDLENILGLTPAGLKRLNSQSMAGRGKSTLAEVLKNLE